MRRLSFLIMLSVMMAACGDSRVYEEYQDFEQRYWLVDDQPEFIFEINDASIRYNLFCNVRNSTSYPFSRLFINYHLQDSSGREIQEKLLNGYLFDVKTGKPFGKSGLGDLYDHQFPLLQNHQFPQPGKYKIKFEQFMRTDTLKGVLAIGLMVEKKVSD